MDVSETLSDQLHRPLRDLRISITDRCNLRCTYCMPQDVYGDDYPFLAHPELLTFDEIERLTKIFVTLGVRKIRITGGEPLMRRHVDQLVQRIATIPNIEDIALTTNGLLLHHYAKKLVKAGLKRINISLDALDASILATINGRDINLDTLLAHIALAQQLGLEVKVNMVVIKGINDNQIIPMAQYFKHRNMTLRFIEFMDVGNDNAWRINKVISKKEILQKLSRTFELEAVEPNYYGEVAKLYQYKDTPAQVGFITSVSESFCSSCTRARLSSDGKLFTCLFASQGFDLRALLRNGSTDETIISEIINVWEGRTDRYSDERTAVSTMRSKIPMSYIGG